MLISKKVTSGEYSFLRSLNDSSIHIYVIHNVITRIINLAQALVFQTLSFTSLHGKTICHSCRNSVAEHIDKAKVKQHEKAFESLVVLLIVMMNLPKYHMRDYRIINKRINSVRNTLRKHYTCIVSPSCPSNNLTSNE